MKQTLLSLIVIALLTGCDAAETNTEDRASWTNSPTWSSVPGGVETRRFSITNPENYQLISGERTPSGVVTNGVFAPTAMRIRTYIQPVQIVKWLNESNVLESVEWPLIQPRLVSETLKTNVVTSAK